MLILIDHADLKEIEALYHAYPYDGVTTNPTILKNAGKSPLKQLKAIRDFLPESSQLHCQLVSETAETMLEESRFMRNLLGENIYLKVPVTAEGLRAIPMLKADGVMITATAIYTAMQAFLAAKAGARYTAPYVNRIDNMGSDGVKVATDIHNMFRAHGLEADVLAASFKNTQQIQSLCKNGIGSVTAAPDVLRAMMKHDSTFTAEENFTKDFYTLVNQIEGTHLK